ncbi:MAG: lipoate--protein ligase family protein [Exilispira sp.]|jgi:lipoate-protein ligase A|nr:lipoate--protein ligase family protein [Exilispira sp.]
MIKNKWRLIIHGENDPFYNMAVDEAIAKMTGENPEFPTLRFYRWNPATLSLGYFQKFKTEIDYEFCKINNIGIVRRITGGRAVLHDDEITYSVCIPANNPIYEKNLIESYKLIAEALAEGLALLNLNPQFNYKKLPDIHSSSACFDAPSLYEITVNGKKIIGSAQKRFQNVFLQHGSIPFTIDSEKLFNCFKFPNLETKDRLKNNFKKIATGINMEKEETTSVEKAINAFVEGFKNKFEIEFFQDDISQIEKNLIEETLYSKYASSEWLEKF